VFYFQAEDGIRDFHVTGVQTCALPISEKSSVTEKIAELSKNKNITFAACQGTMKRHNVDASQLLPGVSVVPDAIMEIVTKQGEEIGRASCREIVRDTEEER